jgi:hypothetical protein
MTEHDVMVRMIREILHGMKWGSEHTRIEQTEHNRKVWCELEADIAQIKKDGMIVAIPAETEVW